MRQTDRRPHPAPPHRPEARRRALLAGFGALWLAAPGLARAQETYPNRPLRIIPFGTAGGPIDTIARVYGDQITQRWGQPVVIEPRPGASGILAADHVAKAAPDGYTLLLTLSLTHTTVPLLQKRVPYDPARDFQPLTQIGTGGPMFAVPVDHPARDLKSFVEWAKAKGRVTYGTWGNGSAAHIMGELLKVRTGAPLDHVPYKGEAAAHVDMFGGLLDAAWANPATARGHVRGGKMKVLGITGSRRVSALPEVPTFGEQGFEGFGLDSWMGFLAPAGTPQAVVARLVDLLREVTQGPEAGGRLRDLGFEPLGNTPAEFTANMRAELPLWASVIEQAKVTIE